jgi:thymidine kinase
MPNLVEYLCDKSGFTVHQLAAYFATTRYREAVAAHLKDHLLETNHLAVNRRINCDLLSERPADSTTAMEFGSRRLTVRDYFARNRRMQLYHPYLPCVGVKGGGEHVSYYPLEVLTITYQGPPARAPRPRGTEAGELFMAYGPMFAGKTTSLVYKTDKWKLEGRKVLIVTPRVDRRSGEFAKTHYGTTREATQTNRMSDIYRRCEDFDCIAVDEAQMIPDVEAGVLALVNKGKKVFVAGLDGLCTGGKWKLFPFWAKLLGEANDVWRLEGDCHRCDQASLYTVRRLDGPREGVIGGAERWTTLCRHCFNRYQTTEGLVSSHPSFVTPTAEEREYWGRRATDNAARSSGAEQNLSGDNRGEHTQAGRAGPSRPNPPRRR